MTTLRVSASLETGIFLDIESTLRGEIREIAYIYRDERVIARTAQERERVFGQLEALAREAAFIGGHNILWHDLPILADKGKCPELLKLPVLDTLLLSPLAFPQKPYHRLIKNDKLVMASKSNPLNDADASRLIAEEALEALGGPFLADWSLIAAFLSAGILPEPAKAGIAMTSRLIGAENISAEEAVCRFTARFGERFCQEGMQRLIKSPAGVDVWLPLAFVAAWIRVAGTDSIVPPWVKRNFPGVNQAMHELRSVPCGNPSCSYCVETHDPVQQLQKFFTGYNAFRPEPSMPEDPARSLQEEIVTKAMGGASPFGYPAHRRGQVALLSTARPAALLSRWRPHGRHIPSSGPHERPGGRARQQDRRSLCRGPAWPSDTSGARGADGGAPNGGNRHHLRLPGATEKPFLLQGNRPAGHRFLGLR